MYYIHVLFGTSKCCVLGFKSVAELVKTKNETEL